MAGFKDDTYSPRYMIQGYRPMMEGETPRDTRGMISPAILRFDDAESALVVAERYARPARVGFRYLTRLYVVQVDRLGYVLRTCYTLDATVIPPDGVDVSGSRVIPAEVNA